MRTLGDVSQSLQRNKAVNLSLAVPRISGILIKPGQTFSFWFLAGKSSRRKGYLNGLIVTSKGVGEGIGGGMCQFTNLIHWMVLHSPLRVIERHHHALDLFPDISRQIPFGTGTSIFYNYLDYQFINDTDDTFQLLISVDDKYLCGELRCSREPDKSYHVYEAEHGFLRDRGVLYRHNRIFRKTIDKRTGRLLSDELLADNTSRVCYGEEFIPAEQIPVVPASGRV
jgi:vancomycin resistance protein VanW